MNRATHAVSRDLSRLAEDARELMNATSDVAGEKVAEARKRLAAALERGREMCDRVEDRVVESAKAADGVVRGHPYEGIAIGVGLGLILGFLLVRGGQRSG